MTAGPSSAPAHITSTPTELTSPPPKPKGPQTFIIPGVLPQQQLGTPDPLSEEDEPIIRGGTSDEDGESSDREEIDAPEGGETTNEVRLHLAKNNAIWKRRERIAAEAQQ